MKARATRTIEGKVLNQLDGVPVTGARVQAWELTWTGDDTYVGESLTAEDGSYRLVHELDGEDRERGEHSGAWRLDIHVTVDVRNAVGAWTRVKKLSVYAQRDPRKHLPMNIHVILPSPFARTVYGYVKWQDDGEPVIGAAVTAYDEDGALLNQAADGLISDHSCATVRRGSNAAPRHLEPAGAAETDRGGYYEIHCAGGRWAPEVWALPWWRPDVLIKVVATVDGQRKEWRSASRDDLPHRNGVRVDLSLERV
jgi:hypothetical protein